MLRNLFLPLIDSQGHLFEEDVEMGHSVVAMFCSSHQASKVFHFCRNKRM